MTALSPFGAQPLTNGLALIVDSQGRVRWYLRADRFITDLQPEPGGRYALSLSNYDPDAFTVLQYTAVEYQELDLAGNLVNKWTATGGYFTDNHDIRFTTRGTAVLLGMDFEIADLTAYGGASNAQILGNVLEEVDSIGRVRFLWNAFDHMDLSDIDPSIPLTAPRIDWNHANAIEIDPDGNYLVSVRNCSQIVKIDSKTGAVRWRLGGVRNEFQFLGDTLKFAFQHGARLLPNGHLILFDNGNTHNPPFSRAVEYEIDEQSYTATKVWEYRPSPDIYSLALGFAQRLRDGNTVVTFGQKGVVHEVNASSELVWTLALPQGMATYRSYRIRSIYDSTLQ